MPRYEKNDWSGNGPVFLHWCPEVFDDLLPGMDSGSRQGRNQGIARFLRGLVNFSGSRVSDWLD